MTADDLLDIVLMRQPGREVDGRKSMAEAEALPLIALVTTQEIELLLRFNALRDDPLP